MTNNIEPVLHDVEIHSGFYKCGYAVPKLLWLLGYILLAVTVLVYKGRNLN